MGGKGGARRARLTSPQQTVGALHAPSTSCARWSRSCAAPDRRAAASEAAAGDCGSVRSPCADAAPAARAASRAWCTRQGRSSRRPSLACEGRTPLRVVPGRCQLRDISHVSYEAQTDSASAAVPLASGAARSARRLRATRRARGGAAARGCVQLHTSASQALALREHGPPLARELPAGNTRRAGRPSVASDGLWSAACAGMTAGSAPPGLRWSPPRTPDAFPSAISTCAGRTAREVVACSAHCDSAHFKHHSMHPLKRARVQWTTAAALQAPTPVRTSA